MRCSPSFARSGSRYPGAHTKSPWPGHLDLAVNDKTFAYLSVEGEPLRISCKLPRRAQVALLLPFTTPTAYGLGKSGWVSAQFAATTRRRSNAQGVDRRELPRAGAEEARRAARRRRTGEGGEGGEGGAEACARTFRAHTSAREPSRASPPRADASAGQARMTARMRGWPAAPRGRRGRDRRGALVRARPAAPSDAAAIAEFLATERAA